MNDAQKYIEIIKKVRSLNYTQNQTACGIAMQDDDQPFNVDTIVSQIVVNIKKCNEWLNTVATIANTYQDSRVAIHKIIRMLTNFIEDYPDLNMVEIINKLLNIIADPNTNDFYKCFLIYQRISLDYYHKLVIKKWN